MGGYNGDEINTAEVYDDPGAGSWTNVASLSNPRGAQTATLLPSGKVLVAGGNTSASGYLTSVELYDPGAHTWTAAASLPTTR